MEAQFLQSQEAVQSSDPGYTLSTYILGAHTSALPAGVRHVCISALSVDIPADVVVGWLQLAAGHPPTGELSAHTVHAINEMSADTLVDGVAEIWRRRVKSAGIDRQRWVNFINAAVRRSKKLNG